MMRRSRKSHRVLAGLAVAVALAAYCLIDIAVSLFVALVWLIPDRRIERVLHAGEHRS
mgnify:CR=1 FL=1